MSLLNKDGDLKWWGNIIFAPLRFLFWLIFSAVPNSIEWLYGKITGEGKE